MTSYFGAFLNFSQGIGDIDWRIYLILPILVVQVLQYWKNDHFVLSKFPVVVRAAVYFGMYCLIFGVGQWGQNEFIYFQF